MKETIAKLKGGREPVERESNSIRRLKTSSRLDNELRRAKPIPASASKGKSVCWDWEPLVSVGPVVFGATPETLAAIPGMRLEKLERSDGQLWSHYWSEQEAVSVMCLDRRLVSAACHEKFLHRGTNLVGMSEANVKMRFRDQLTSLGEFPDGHTLEIAALGLELTITDGTVLIATAFDEPLAGFESRL